MLVQTLKNKIIPPAIVTIGNFDGVHLGHQKIIEKTLELSRAHSLQPVLMTFEPYPHEFFKPELRVARIMNLREKVNFIRKHYFNDVVVLKFNRLFSQLSAEDFIEKFLIKKLNTKHVVIGEDFHFGFQRLGDASSLQHYFPVEIVKPVIREEQRVSSTWLRKILSRADFDSAKKLLGHDYSLMGKVIKGQQRGRLLGFPTANIALNRRVPPFMGVYAVKVNHSLKGIANLGIRPTVNHDKKIFLEVNLFDVEEDLYGQWLEVTFCCKIRDEKRFDSLDALKEQIHQDVIKAREFFEQKD